MTFVCIDTLSIVEKRTTHMCATEVSGSCLVMVVLSLHTEVGYVKAEYSFHY